MWDVNAYTFDSIEDVGILKFLNHSFDEPDLGNKLIFEQLTLSFEQKEAK